MSFYPFLISIDDHFQINDKEMIMEVDLDDDIIDKSLTKYRDVKDDVLNTCAAVSPYHQVEIVTQQESKETISWLYDTPGLFNKNQVLFKYVVCTKLSKNYCYLSVEVCTCLVDTYFEK